MSLSRFKSALSGSVIGVLLDDTSGVALTEFAFAAPIFLTLGLVGALPKEVMGHNVVVLDQGTAIEPFGLAAAEASGT